MRMRIFAHPGATGCGAASHPLGLDQKAGMVCTSCQGVQPGVQSSSCTCNKMSPSPVKYLLAITVSPLPEGASLPVIPQVLAYLSMCLILNPVSRAHVLLWRAQSAAGGPGVTPVTEFHHFQLKISAKFMVWWHSCSECSPLPCALFLVFPAALKRTGFSGFLRSGMHTLCHGKEPVREHRVQMLLKRNPRLSGAVVAWSHHPVLLAHSQQLALLSRSVVLIPLELAFSLAYGNAEHKQFP